MLMWEPIDDVDRWDVGRCASAARLGWVLGAAAEAGSRGAWPWARAATGRGGRGVGTRSRTSDWVRVSFMTYLFDIVVSLSNHAHFIQFMVRYTRSERRSIDGSSKSSRHRATHPRRRGTSWARAPHARRLTQSAVSAQTTRRVRSRGGVVHASIYLSFRPRSVISGAAPGTGVRLGVRVRCCREEHLEPPFMLRRFAMIVVRPLCDEVTTAANTVELSQPRLVRVERRLLPDHLRLRPALNGRIWPQLMSDNVVPPSLDDPPL